MSNETTGKPSAAELEKLKALRDEDIVPDEDEPYDPNDPAAVEAFWKDAVVTHGGGPQAVREALAVRRRPGQRGPQKAPTKVFTAIRLDADVIEYFKSQGPGWQTRINEALRKLMEESS